MKKITSFLIIVLLVIATDADAQQKKLRKFYLTVNAFDGNEVLTACSRGYHMASLWEIFDTSNLSYNTDLGFANDDSGSGPPATVKGWIPTGSFSSSEPTSGPGGANCAAWTKDAEIDFGTAVELESRWGQFPIPGNAAPATNISPWGTENFLCSHPLPVWCVED